MVLESPIKKRDPPVESPFPTADDPEVLDPILDELEADDDVRRLAREIASTAESTMWIIGKRRSTVAATAVYVAGEILNPVSPVFKQPEVADASAASLSSIATRHGELRELYETVAAPQG